MSYVLIDSNEEDYSTEFVINWLNYFNQNVIRLNSESPFNLIKIELDKNKPYAIFSVDNKIINTNDIKSFWYRRGDIKIEFKFEHEGIDEKLKKRVYNHLFHELTALKDAIYIILEERKTLGSFFNHSINKIQLLVAAKKIGLEIPKTIICNNRRDLEEFSRKNISIITKSIQEMGIFEIINKKSNMPEVYGLYTTEVNSKLIENFPEVFLFSKFQEKLDKAIELRIFILDDKVFSMAIFSQSNIKTKVDFRKYDFKTPNRNVPFKLPFEIEEKLLKLMKCMELTTGSVDMILTKEGKYVFLEINPIGQFGMVSSPCNYYLEKKIAQYLMN